jgi:hypothetical protein
MFQQTVSYWPDDRAGQLDGKFFLTFLGQGVQEDRAASLKGDEDYRRTRCLPGELVKLC